jgi:sugar O-acyltransferase (sialic acid O-acetyltransferase NeuD family)
MRGQVPGDWVMTQDAPIVVVGAGGHGKVVLATIEAAGGEVAGVLDDDAALWGTRILGHLVTGPIADAGIPAGAVVFVAAGANSVRKAIAARLRGPFGTVVHSSVALGAGTVVFAGAVIQPDTTLGRHVIVNTGASVDHDSSLGDYVHIAPGVRLAGDVWLDEGVFMGVGSCAIPGARVGRWATIGAGGVVLNSIPPGVTAVGLPARVVGGRR